MSYEMKILRKEDLSLYHHIKDTVLRDFVEREEYVALTYMSELSNTNSYVYQYDWDLDPRPDDRGRGWLYFDAPVNGLNCEPFPTYSGLNGDGDPAYGTPEQSNRVIVYETTTSGYSIVDWQDYMIDYVDCRIISTRELTDPLVTFDWNYVSVVDEWAVVEAATTPVVVVDIDSTRKKGYQLGGGKKSIRGATIHIFASNTAERNDLVETLYNGLYLRSCPLFDFPTGDVLDYDGTFYGRADLTDRIPIPDNKLTYLFDRDKVEYVEKLEFDNVNSRNVNFPIFLSKAASSPITSDLNTYRAKITFNIVSYDDRIINI